MPAHEVPGMGRSRRPDEDHTKEKNVRKPLIVATLATAGALAAYGFGQFGDVTPTFAAQHAAKIHKSTSHGKKTTGKKTTGRNSRGNAEGQNATPHADGTITGINGDVLTVKPDNDPAGSTEYTKVTTITLTTSTKYAAGKGTTTTTRPTFTVGEYIVAEGTVSSDGTSLTATLVSAGKAGGHGGGNRGGPHADGTVTGVNGNNVSVTPDNDPAGSNEYTKVTTIVLTNTTQFDTGKGATTTTRPTISAGQFIIAEGTVSSDGTTLTATHVSLRASKGH
jgi:hypothetical protein